MQSKAETVDAYIAELPPERQAPMQQLRDVINANLPEGFEETMGYGMPAWVVPHSLYPDGYHCDPKLPLPFLNMASQKYFVGLYHMGIYVDDELLAWFQDEYAKVVPTKLDMGKSCIRFKRIDRIPFELVGELVARMTPQDWIDRYESSVRR